MKANIHKQYFGNLWIVFDSVPCWLGVLAILWCSWENLELWVNLCWRSLWSCIVSASCLEIVLCVGSPGPSLLLETSQGSCSKHINLEGIHSFSLCGNKKTQSNICLDPNFEVKIPLCLLSLAALIIHYLLVISSFSQNFIESTVVYIIQTLCVFSLFMWLIIT